MNARLCWALAFSSSAAALMATGGTEACRPCHAAIVESWQRTGMGRSVLPAQSMPGGDYYHRLSNRHYAIQQGTVRRHQVGVDRREVNVLAKAVDFIIGSGKHAMTPVHRTPLGKFVEMPVSWYARHRQWAMSPGYDRPDHLGFRRPITSECLFCHAAYPKAGETQPRAIDCVRCHGRVDTHLRRPGRGNILNPSRLAPARQLDVCLQCHLETASRGFPDSLRRPGREVYSFRPGEALSDYKAYFDRADGADRFEINHAGYRLLQSSCFTKSGGRMTCTTCHDPHSSRTRNACLDCHGTLATTHPGGREDCSACHMPKRTAEDAIHVQMTDHRIARHSESREVTREDHAPYVGEIVEFSGLADDAMLARARALHHAQSLGTAELWKKTAPSTGNLAALGDALMREGAREEARRVLSRVLKTEPDHVMALNALAVYEGTRSRLDEALRLLERARRADPDHPLTWINLGVTREAMGDVTEALACYSEAVRLQPDSEQARRRRQALLDSGK
jgi:tetratricopeptide (TPR) repeat protein